MGALGKRDLADEVRPVQEKVALLNIGYGARWLILPDVRVIPWRYAGDRGLLDGAKRTSSMRRIAPPTENWAAGASEQSCGLMAPSSNNGWHWLSVAFRPSGFQTISPYIRTHLRFRNSETSVVPSQGRRATILDII